MDSYFKLLDFDLLKNSAALFDIDTRKRRDETARILSGFFHKILVEVIKPDYFLEVGAFNAEFSMKIKPQLHDTSFHAFEANPHNFKKFSQRLNDAGINYEHTAIADYVGTATFNLQTKFEGKEVNPVIGNNSILERNQTDVEYEKISVACNTVDNLFKGRIDPAASIAMWVDVEGMAHQVLSAASETLKNTKIILVELEDREHWAGQRLAVDVIELMYAKGFVPIARDFEWPYQYNVIFIQSDLLKNYMIRDLLAQYYSGLIKKRNTFDWKKIFQ